MAFDTWTLAATIEPYAAFNIFAADSVVKTRTFRVFNKAFFGHVKKLI